MPRETADSDRQRGGWMFEPSAFDLVRSSPARAWLVLTLWVSGLAMLLAQGVDAPVQGVEGQARSFIRFQKTGADEGRLETAVKTYQRADGVTVALVSAVHIADRAYYERLGRLFESYDALLYEMIRDREVEGPVTVDTGNPISQLQILMKRALELEFQLDAVDYTRTNFVHADLDPATFFRLQEEQGESLLGLMLRVVLEEQARAAQSPGRTVHPIQLLLVLLSPDRAQGLKFLLGQQMDQIELMLAGIERGQDGQGSVIVARRNEHAVKVLEEQIAKGGRKLGIFYGAGHMPDFERRLEAQGYELREEKWFTAWDIRKKRKGDGSPKASPP